MSGTAANHESRSPASAAVKRSASEEALCRIFAEVLRLPAVDTRDNFFDLGGDSLKAMDVIVQVSQTLHVELPLIAFFEDPTVVHLAEIVDAEQPSAAVQLRRRSGQTRFPLASAQQVFWLLEQQNPGTGIYNTTRIFRLHGAVNSEVMERALNELCRRNEILRVRFIQGVDGPEQVVDGNVTLRLPVTDLRGMEASAREQAASKIAMVTVREPFDLQRGPVLRAHLARLADDESLLAMAVHHVVSDGFTGSILLDELGTIYDALAAGEAVPLAEPDLHFTDYAAWEQEWMQGTRLQEELDYWRLALEGAPSSVELPTDSARTSDPDRQGKLRSVTIPLGLFEKLHTLARSNGTTLFTVLSAALRALLYRWSNQTDFLIGTVSSNRSRSGTERMMGCFVNPLPVRNALRDGQTILDLLNTEKTAIMDAFAHQDCPFAKIVEAINPERSRNDNPLFNVALVIQNFPAIAFEGRSFRAEYIEFDAEVALLDLRFVAIETRDGLQLSCEYKSSLFTEETVDAVLRAFGAVLKEIENDPAKPVAGVTLPEALEQQAARARARDHQPAIAIAASFTAQPVEAPLSFLLGELGMRYRVTFAPYDQVFQQLLDPGSLVRTADGFGIVLLRFEDWLHGDAGPDDARQQKLDRMTSEFIAALRGVPVGAGRLIVAFCPPSRAMAQRAGWSERLESLEVKVAAACASSEAVEVIRSGELVDLYPVDEYEDEYAQRLGNVPFTSDFFSALGTMLVRRMWTVAENRYKVIAMDCDHVLWNGACEPGDRARVDEGRLALQRSLRAMSSAGVLLCLCTTRPERDVWASFENNREMIIGRDDLVASAAGCKTSAEGLRGLADELGLGLDSFIFLHADPAECAAVEAACPEALTLQVPEDSSAIPEWLRHVWAFDAAQKAGAKIDEGSPCQ